MVLVHRPTTVSIFIVAIFFISSLTLTTQSFCSNSDVITAEDMRIYVQTFLAEYNEELEEEFRPQFRKYFPFHWDYSYQANVTISNVRGVAVQFTP